MKLALKEGFPSVRVAFDRDKRSSHASLLGGETGCLLDRMMERRKCIVACQYRQSDLDPHAVPRLLRRHPVLAVGSEVFKNPYYIPPEKLNRDAKAEGALQFCLSHIRKQERMETVLLELDEKFRALVRTSPGVILVLDLEGKIVNCSLRCAELHGYGRPEEVIGKKIADLVVPGERARLARDIRRAAREGLVQRITYSLLKKDGSSLAALFAGIIPDTSATTKHSKTPRRIHAHGITKLVFNIIERTFPIRIPRRIPIRPPIWAMTIDSTRNWLRMVNFVAPIAFRMPISCVLSVTDTSMMFIRPMAAPMSVMRPMKVAANATYLIFSSSISAMEGVFVSWI